MNKKRFKSRLTHAERMWMFVSLLCLAAAIVVTVVSHSQPTAEPVSVANHFTRGTFKPPGHTLAKKERGKRGHTASDTDSLAGRRRHDLHRPKTKAPKPASRLSTSRDYTRDL